MAQTAPASAMDRVGDLLREVGVAPSVERAKERSEELVRALVAFYGEGLERVLDIVHEAAGDRSAAIFAALCGDKFVEGLLALHGLHPLSLEDRVQAALDSIRPYLESHEGSVELLRVEDGIAYVRLAGSCDGCQSSAATLKNAVETAVLEGVAELTGVRAEGVPTVAPAAASSLKLQSDWVELDAVPELAANGIAHVRCAGTPVLLVGANATIFAYRDRCPACLNALDNARLEWPFVCCAGCGGSFDVVHAGRVAGDEQRAAEPFPLVRDGTRIRLAIPVGA